MRVRRTRSIRRASFFGMLGGSLFFVVINFIILSAFAITMVYLFMSSQEENLSKVLINNLTEKQQRLISMSSTLADIVGSTSSENEKSLYLEKSIYSSKDIEGILILNNMGIITDTTNNYNDFLGIDFSGKDYYKGIITIKDKKTFISDSYISYKTKKVTLNIVSPIVKDNIIQGMVVLIVNPSIIENKDLNGLEYYLVDSNGDIIFQSYEGNVVSNEDNIKSSLIMDKGLKTEKPIFYKDKIKDEYVLGDIRKEPVTSMYILVQHNIFSNQALINGLLIFLGATILFVTIFIVVFSAEMSNTVINYIIIFKNQLKKITTGDYDIELSNMYPHDEINDIIESFTNMAVKIKQREEELQAYNEELVAANDEIKSMIDTIGRNEKEKKEQYLQIIWTMVNLLEIKDEYTAGHSKSVTFYAEEIAERLNRDYGFKLDIESIQVSAILHDIGKIGIEKEILSKPSGLTEEEYEIIKTHPIKGYYALKDIESLKEERKIIKYHHERYDGIGYPEGIKGDAIPFGARIICVADAFDAMISDRPYRKGLSIEQAINELKKNRGAQFDPLIVDVFVCMLHEGELGAANN